MDSPHEERSAEYYQELGAFCWMRAHPADSLLFFRDGLYDAKDCVQALIKDGHATADLETIGRGAMKTKPVNDNRGGVQKKMTFGKHLSTACFPPYSQDVWAMVDASVPSSESDDSKRYARGPMWKKNSCAVDCVMVAALLLDGGRTHVDQVNSAFHRTLSFPARALLRMLLKPWSKLAQDDINALRDVLRDILEEHDDKRFKIGPMLSISQVANELLVGMPQLLTTITKVFRCADGHGLAFRTKDDGTLTTTLMLGCLGGMDSTRASWEIPAGMERNPGALMSLYFQPRPATKEELKRDPQPCCEREDCPGTETQLVVVDRLAPVLMLEENWEGNGFAFSPMVSYQIRYCDEALREHTAAYTVLGIVYNSSSHFSLEWYGEDEKCNYDGMLGGSIKSKRTGRLSSAKKALIFMERVMETSEMQ